ncbi:unannotated protein [freshwater metagenome]|uniref:Unannotated protein n=1 Tax=freshwater metagenome TaxID=449393 RepID=A0A6J7KMI8_9ZZZZ|nr:hypothetical protein [Actinomycetota bacterium]
MRFAVSGSRRLALIAGAAAITTASIGIGPIVQASAATICTTETAPAWSARARIPSTICGGAGISATTTTTTPLPTRPPAVGVNGVFTVPSSIDATGATEVSTALQEWFSSIPPASAAEPMTIRFANSGTYWSDYTLLLRKRTGNVTGGISGNMWRHLPSFDASNVTLDLNGSTIVQRKAQPWRWGGGEVLDPRKRWGNPMIFTAGATNVRITNGFLVGSQKGDRYDPNREDWMGILIGGDNDYDLAQNMKIDHLGIRNVWGDFIYLASQTSRGKLLKDVTIEDNIMRNAGRQGIVIHGGNNLLIQRNDFSNVKRYLFDSEPAPVHGWKDVTITANTGESGNLGYFQFIGNKTSEASGLSITNNTISEGHLAMEIGNGSDSLRAGATITENRSLDPTEFRRSNLHRSLITISRWSSVNISGNSDRVVANSQPFALNTERSNATVGVNNWSGR